jgi:hypothetical protein
VGSRFPTLGHKAIPNLHKKSINIKSTGELERLKPCGIRLGDAKSPMGVE